MKYDYETHVRMYFSVWEVRESKLIERANLHALAIELNENMGARKYYNISGRLVGMLEFWQHCAADGIKLRIEGENQPIANDPGPNLSFDPM